METVLFSPSPSPTLTLSPLEDTRDSVCPLNDIIAQLSCKKGDARFQCLAWPKHRNCSERYRCTQNSQNFKTAHRDLYAAAIQILSEDLTVPIEYPSVVFRILFCETHQKANAFKKFSEVYQTLWKGNGSKEEIELLKAIRHVCKLATQSHAATPAALASPMLNTFSPPYRTFDGMESAGHTTYRQPSKVQYSFALTEEKDCRESVEGHPRLELVIDPSDKSEPSRPLPPSVQPRYARSRSNPTRSNPPKFTFVFGDPSMATVRSGHLAGTVSAKTTERSTSSSSPPRSSLTSTCSTAFAQSPLSSGFAPSPGGLPSSASLLMLHPSSATKNQRPCLSEQPKAATEPALSLPECPMPNSDAAHPESPVMNNLSERGVGSLPASFSPADWNVHWGISLKPAGAGVTRVSRDTPQRQGSKDDTYLPQLARIVDSAAPNMFNVNRKPQIPASVSTGRAGNPFGPVIIDSMIRDEIMNPVTKEGHIYILESPRYFKSIHQEPLLKIGMSINTVGRMKSLTDKCGLFDLAQVDDPEDRHLPLYWKVEKLVHAELSNYQRILNCNCGPNGDLIRHREWFAVEKHVAQRTVERWRKFIEQNPYDENGLLKAFWSDKILPRKMLHPKRDEKWDHWTARDERWTKWLEGTTH